MDGDLSGGRLIDQYHRELFTPEIVGKSASVLDPRIDRETASRQTHGVQAQNYHVFTPPGPARTGRWNGAAPNTGSNGLTRSTLIITAASPGESVFITPSDYSGCEGPWRALETVLTENKLIGMGLGLIDWEGANTRQRYSGDSTIREIFVGIPEIVSNRP